MSQMGSAFRRELILPPVGATGSMTAELRELVRRDFAKLYRNASTGFRQAFDQLGDSSKTPDELRSIQKLIDELQKV
jgi:hypothetical protein